MADNKEETRLVLTTTVQETDVIKEKIQTIIQNLTDLKRSSYGMAYDENLTIPTKPTTNGVELAINKRKKEIRDIHQQIDRLVSGVRKVERDIESNQRTTHKVAAVKKQNQRLTEFNEQTRKRLKQQHEKAIASFNQSKSDTDGTQSKDEEQPS